MDQHCSTTGWPVDAKNVQAFGYLRFFHLFAVHPISVARSTHSSQDQAQAPELLSWKGWKLSVPRCSEPWCHIRTVGRVWVKIIWYCVSVYVWEGGLVREPRAHTHLWASFSSDVCVCVCVNIHTYLCSWHRDVMPGLHFSVQWSRRGNHAVLCVNAEELLYVCVPRYHIPTQN